jgi:AraC-like DNA-binding protein
MSGRRTHGLRKIERYRLDQFWCLNLFQGEGELHIQNAVYPFKEGYAGITWPDVDLVYKFQNKTIKTWVHFIPRETEGEPCAQIPIMQDLGPEFEGIKAELQTISSLYRMQPARAVAKLWDILWQLVRETHTEDSPNPQRHPIVTRAMDEIDMHISETIGVEALAGELDISQTHLNRLFKATTGTTVGHYIRERRMEAARHLLMHTTMPIKQIACHVGIPDTQHFNKLVRQYYQQSPTQLRRSRGT